MDSVHFTELITWSLSIYIARIATLTDSHRQVKFSMWHQVDGEICGSVSSEMCAKTSHWNKWHAEFQKEATTGNAASTSTMSYQATVLPPDRKHLETYSRCTALNMKSQRHQNGLAWISMQAVCLEGDRLQDSDARGAPTSTGVPGWGRLRVPLLHTSTSGWRET